MYDNLSEHTRQRIRTAVGAHAASSDVLAAVSTGTTPFPHSATRSTIANSATPTAAEMRGRVLYQDASGGNVSMTTRTGTQLAGDFPELSTGQCVTIFVASNHGSNTATLTAGDGVTNVGGAAVTQIGGTFLLIKTGSATFDLVRVG